MVNIAWTEQMIKVLEHDAKKGKSASEIAKRLEQDFGFPMTRNSVIGKAHRNGIKLGREKIALPKKEVIVVEPIKKFKMAVKFVEQNFKEPVKPVAPNHILEKGFTNPAAIGVELLDLKENQCRYPIGDVRTNDLLFCGAPTEVGRPYSYCSYCYPVVYVPARYHQRQTAKKNSQPV